MYNAQEVYSDLLLMLRDCLSPIAFETFFSPEKLSPVCIDDNILILETPEPIAKEVISQRFKNVINQCLQALNYTELSFRVVDKDSFVENDPERIHKKHIAQLAKEAGLNPRYTFDNFVSGSTNYVTYASCVAVADAPGSSYNPLYIWGDSGLGKTHLMHAIGHYVLEKDPTKKVLYISSETFLNEMITAMASNTSAQFREKYRAVDVLLIDDIQFLGGKKAAQEEFFHTFNTLYEAGKQIVISGDRVPDEVSNLEDRIRTRFMQGFITDIQAPDYEMRVAILQKKAENNNINIDLSVLSYIATYITDNSRSLEGALTRVYGYSRLFKDHPIDIEMAQEALKDYINNDEANLVTIPRIITVVCERFQLSNEDMISKKKPREIAYPRMIAMYLCRDMTEEPLQSIGSYFGGRDHTTVIHACDKIKDDLSADKSGELAKSIEDMRRRILGE